MYKKTNTTFTNCVKVRSFGTKITKIWWLLLVTIKMVGFHLHPLQFWPLNLKSIENTAIQQNICLLTFALRWKTKLRKTKLQRHLHIGPACAKDLRNERTKVHQQHSKTYKN